MSIFNVSPRTRASAPPNGSRDPTAPPSRTAKFCLSESIISPDSRICSIRATCSAAPRPEPNTLVAAVPPTLAAVAVLPIAPATLAPIVAGTKNEPIEPAACPILPATVSSSGTPNTASTPDCSPSDTFLPNAPIPVLPVGTSSPE